MTSKSSSIVISSHVVFVGRDDVFGPGHAISSFLNLKNINHYYIKHSLYDSRQSIIEYNKSSKKKISSFQLPKYFPGTLRHLAEVLSVIYFLTKKRRVKLFIGIDPLNAFSGIIAKKLGAVETVIFYTADYAYSRFENKLLNSLYHSLDKFAIKNSDCVWNVSSRITKIRKEQGIEDKRNIFIPNAPILRLMPKFKRKHKLRRGLVLMANFTPAINYDLIVRVISDLKHKYSDISVSFIGTGIREPEIKQLVKRLKLDKNVRFLGLMKHNDALGEIAKNSIGLAPYSSEWSWTAFGDSLKAREYLAFGLPVIMNKGVSTGDDIEKYNAGFVIDLNKRSLLKVLSKLLSDSTLYDSMRRNALKMAREVDLEKILNKHLLHKFNI